MTTRAAHAETVDQARQALLFGISEEISRVRGDSSAPATTRPDLVDALIAAVRHEAGADRLHPPITAEQLAERFHEIYERRAPDFGYRTREASAKPWDAVPEGNKGLMIATCREVLAIILHPHEDGADNGSCAPDNPSVISGPDQAATTTEAVKELIRQYDGLVAEMVSVLKAACDRNWTDETPIQVAHVAANALHWRDQEIATLRRFIQTTDGGDSQVGGCLPNTPNKAASPSGGLSRASHQPETEVGSGNQVAQAERAASTGRSASAIQHSQIAPPEDEQTDQARSGAREEHK